MTYPKIVYKVHFHEHIPMKTDFSVEDWLNELGQEGWVLCDINQSAAPSGLFTADNQAIPKIIVQALMLREEARDE